MKTRIIFLTCILLLAAFLRLWQIGNVPLSLDWDEAALGYNAYSILHTGKDEYGKSFPVVLESFGDYKPALYAYLIIPFIPIFDLTPVAVRLPSALFGLVAVLFTYFLVKELFGKHGANQNGTRNYAETIALIAAFLLAVSPWSIQFSRVGFESNVGMALNLMGIVFFLKGLKKPLWFSLSAVLFALSLYVYQSEKLFVPLLLLILLGVYWKKFFSASKKYIGLSVVIFIIAALPIVLFTFTNKGGLARAEGVSFFSNTTSLLQQDAVTLQIDRQKHDILGLLFDNRRIVYAKTIVQAYLSHYDLNWWFITGDSTNRHHAPEMGLLYLVDLPFLFAGFYFLFFGRLFAIEKRTKIFLLLWFLAAPIPASITTGVPHAVRTENFLPTFQIFIALGIVGTFLFFEKKQRIKYVVYGLISFFYIFNFAFYLNQYFVQTNYYYAKDWIYGYQQAIDYLKPLQSQYKKIIISNNGYMDQSYIFFLFYEKYDPKKYLAEGGTQLGGTTKFSNFEFRKFNYADEDNLPALLVGTDSDFPGVSPDLKDIYFLDGSLAMRVVEKK